VEGIGPPISLKHIATGEYIDRVLNYATVSGALLIQVLNVYVHIYAHIKHSNTYTYSHIHTHSYNCIKYCQKKKSRVHGYDHSYIEFVLKSKPGLVKAVARLDPRVDNKRDMIKQLQEFKDRVCVCVCVCVCVSSRDQYDTHPTLSELLLPLH
jgi:hypothetical protein